MPVIPAGCRQPDSCRPGHNGRELWNGLIAQETELIIPEVVRTGDDGLKSIEYQILVGLLLEAIKVHQKQINDLKLILKNNNLN
jgi:hypothetical protein